MNQNEMSRAVGQLEGRMEGVENRIRQDEQTNATEHQNILVKVDVNSTEVLEAIKHMREHFDRRISSLEDTVSVSKAWFKAIKLFVGATVMILMFKFGDAKDALKEAWKALL